MDADPSLHVLFEICSLRKGWNFNSVTYAESGNEFDTDFCLRKPMFTELWQVCSPF